jgi:hypothetical protein
VLHDGVVVGGGTEHPNINVFTRENAILAQNSSCILTFRTVLGAWARPFFAVRHISLVSGLVARVG